MQGGEMTPGEGGTPSLEKAPGTGDERVGGRRRRRRWILWLTLIVVVVAGWLYLNRPVETRIAWGDDLEAALVAAGSRGVPVVVHFTSPGCPYCWAMERHVLPNERVEAALDDYVAVRIDTSSEPEVAARYHVEAVPTFVVLTENGDEVRRAMGYHSAKEFMRFLRGGGDSASSSAS
jgi:thioredoxin-related protein